MDWNGELAELFGRANTEGIHTAIQGLMTKYNWEFDKSELFEGTRPNPLTGIKPRKKQLEANKQAKPPNDVKIILSYSISSGRTLRKLPLLPHLCSNWLKRIPDTREATT